MIHWTAENGWRDLSKELTESITREKDPWSDLRPDGPAQEYSGPTVEAFLGYVVAGSKYQPADVVAIGIGTTHSFHGEKLHAAYLTPRGVEEATEPGDLEKPYTLLEEALSGPIRVEELTEANLERVGRMTGPEKQRTLIDWGGPDGRSRVVAIYAKDDTANIFHSLKQSEPTSLGERRRS